MAVTNSSLWWVEDWGVRGMLAPQRYVDWLSENAGFNPRSQRHSNVLSNYILDDLIHLSTRIADDVERGVAQIERNRNVETLVAFRNVDFVLTDVSVEGPLRQTRLSIEHKSIMTAHGKARKNRLGDIFAYVNHIHNHNPMAIAAVTMVINTSPAYINPDSFARELERTHLTSDSWARLIRETVRLFASIPLRHSSSEPNDQPEALAIILVEYNGEGQARLITDSPAPQPGDPYHVAEFYSRIIKLYEERF